MSLMTHKNAENMTKDGHIVYVLVYGVGSFEGDGDCAGEGEGLTPVPISK